MPASSLTSSAAAANSSRILPARVRSSLGIYCGALAALTILAWGLAWFNGSVLRLPYPWNWPLFRPGVRFSDLTDYSSTVRNIAQGGSLFTRSFPLFPYPAPALFVYSFFIRIFPDPVAPYLVFSGIVWFAGFEVVRRYAAGADGSRTVDATVAITALCAYPFLFAVDRGNIEIVVFALVAAGLVFFVRENYWTSVALFAAAAAVKPFPLLFLCLFLKKKRYKEIAVAAAAIGVTYLIALQWLGPTIPVAHAGLRASETTWMREYVYNYRDDEIHFEHSLFTCVKQAIRAALGWPSPGTLRVPLLVAYWIYTPLAALFTLVCAWHFWRKPLMNQLFAIVIIMLMIPPVSGDYTLMYIYLLWAVFFIRQIRDGSTKHPLLFLIPMAILMAPLSWLRTDVFGVGGQLKALVLLFLLGVAAKIDLPSGLFGDLAGHNERI